jgi:hypothetical protein
VKIIGAARGAASGEYTGLAIKEICTHQLHSTTHQYSSSICLRSDISFAGTGSSGWEVLACVCHWKPKADADSLLEIIVSNCFFKSQQEGKSIQ